MLPMDWLFVLIFAAYPYCFYQWRHQTPTGLLKRQ